VTVKMKPKPCPCNSSPSAALVNWNGRAVCDPSVSRVSAMAVSGLSAPPFQPHLGVVAPRLKGIFHESRGRIEPSLQGRRLSSGSKKNTSSKQQNQQSQSKRAEGQSAFIRKTQTRQAPLAEIVPHQVGPTCRPGPCSAHPPLPVIAASCQVGQPVSHCTLPR
jgi:hypothetical protein